MGHHVAQRERHQQSATASMAGHGCHGGMHSGERVGDGIATNERQAGHLLHESREPGRDGTVISEGGPAAARFLATIAGDADPCEATAPGEPFFRDHAQLSQGSRA
ncbi:MAG: hypothetical protein U1F35_06780 [Steroidobacteraceae bacterium]